MTANLTAYTLRRLDPQLWNRARARARQEGRTMHFVFCEFLKVYAEHGFDVVVEPFRAKRRSRNGEKG